MEKQKISDKSAAALFKELMKTAEISQSCNKNDGRELELGKDFSLSGKNGRLIYESLTDGDLINILQKRAAQLGHSPSQKEMFWVLREYIKVRFKKWPSALRAAGLPTSAGSGSVPEPQNDRLKELLNMVRDRAVELGRIPHTKDMPEVCGELGNYMDTWGEVIKAAGIQKCFAKKKSVYKIKELEPEYTSLLKGILEMSAAMGRPPMHQEVEKGIRQKLISRCGSWRNALYQIRLEPVIKIKPFSDSFLKGENANKNHVVNLQDCYYRILNPSEETLGNLERMQDICTKLRRMPTKRDVPRDTASQLIAACGSWQNAIYQLKFYS